MHFPSSDNPWENAFFKQSYDAAVGRLFRGLIHNLNGALQAVSMQSELMAMMLGQSLENYLSRINKTEEELIEELRPSAARRVSRSLVLGKIAEDEKIP